MVVQTARMASSASWRAFDSLLIIDAVQTKPVLYNTRLKEFRNNKIKENAWKAVAASVQGTVEECQRRWKNLREMFVKLHKKQPSGSGYAGGSQDSWILEALSFLAQRSSETNLTLDQSTSPEVERDGASTQDEDDDRSVTDQSSTSATVLEPVDDESAATPRPKVVRNAPEKSKKRWTNDVSDREMFEAILKCGSGSTVPQPALDEFDTFGQSVGQTIRRLAGRQQAWVKMKITQLLFEAEFGSETGTPSPVGGLPYQQQGQQYVGASMVEQAESGQLVSVYEDEGTQDSAISAGHAVSAAAVVDDDAGLGRWEIASCEILAQAMTSCGIPANVHQSM